MPPPPGAAYRVLVKAGMRPRQERVLLLTAMATHVVFTSALLAPSALWRPRVAAGTAALVFGALLPLLLVRRTRLLAAAPEPASRAARMSLRSHAPPPRGRTSACMRCLAASLRSCTP